MAIEPEPPRTPLPPLKKEMPPVVPVEALLAVAQVRLTAADIPPKILRQFYEHVLGLKFVAADADGLYFAHLQRSVVLLKGAAEGVLGLLTRDFPEVLVRLRDAGVAFDLLHTDSGLTRQATLRDPAGNWVHLVETRPL